MDNQGRWVDRLPRPKVATYEDHTVVLKQRAPKYCTHYLAAAFQFLSVSGNSGDSFLYERESPYANAVPRNNQSLVWIASNQEQLYRDYPNEWILVSNQVVVAHSHSAPEIETAARELGIADALITKAVKPTPSERTIYVFG